MNWQKKISIIEIILFFILFSISVCLFASNNSIYQNEEQRINQAEKRLAAAIDNPEYLLEHWVELPTSPESRHKKLLQLSLREAILLGLRYNPNIQNAELDRIIQRYQLRLAHNEFELQYALAGAAAYSKNQYSGVGSANSSSFLATPEVGLKTKAGTQLSLNLENNVAGYNSFMPVLNFTLTQPLLRGFGRAANEAGLLDAQDSELINKLTMQQSVIDQITQIILSYRSLVLSGNNLKNQQRQLKEAHKSFEINEKRIEAGQLEPTANIQQSYQIESLKLLVEQAENDFKTAAQDLLQSIGLDPKTHLSVPSDVQVEHLVVPSLKESINLALMHNVPYLAQKMALRVDERAYKVAKNQQLWQLDLGVNVQSGVVTDVDTNGPRGLKAIYSGQDTAETARLTLTVPLHDLSRRSQLISIKVRLEKDKLNLIAAKRALETTVTNIVNMIESQLKRYQLAKKQVKLAQQSYVLENKKQRAGIASALDVNNTQNQLIQAQIGLISAKIAYLNQLSTLERVIGTTLEHWQIKLRYTG